MNRLTNKKLIDLKYGEFTSLSKEEYRKQVNEAPTYKETPMLVTDIHVDEFYCPKCHSEITHDINNYGARPRYCEDCGQRLDWGHYE